MQIGELFFNIKILLLLILTYALKTQQNFPS